MRVVLASDLHYGQEGTDYVHSLAWFTEKVRNPKPDLVIFNGDLIHDQAHYLSSLKEKLDKLPSPWIATRGNHDRVEATYWNDIIGTPVNYIYHFHNYSFILLDTTDHTGSYHAPDKETMHQFIDQVPEENKIVIVQHVPDASLSHYGTPNQHLYKNATFLHNVSAFLFGHDHSQYGGCQFLGRPAFFGGHLGGSWGEFPSFLVLQMDEDVSLKEIVKMR